MDWHGACIVPLFKGKDEQYDETTLEVFVC